MNKTKIEIKMIKNTFYNTKINKTLLRLDLKNKNKKKNIRNINKNYIFSMITK